MGRQFSEHLSVAATFGEYQRDGKKFPAFLQRHDSDPKIIDFYKLFSNHSIKVHLASMDIEHDSHYRKFNGKYLDVFFLIGVFILLIAAVNFMNLTTARSHTGGKNWCAQNGGAKKFHFSPKKFVLESGSIGPFALIHCRSFRSPVCSFVNNLNRSSAFGAVH